MRKVKLARNLHGDFSPLLSATTKPLVIYVLHERTGAQHCYV
jgi:hypothetical protein